MSIGEFTVLLFLLCTYLKIFIIKNYSGRINRLEGGVEKKFSFYNGSLRHAVEDSRIKSYKFRSTS